MTRSTGGRSCPVRREDPEYGFLNQWGYGALRGIPGRSQCAVFRAGLAGMGTAHSSPAFSASSRPAVGVPESGDARPSTRRMRFLRAELAIVFGCCQTQGGTAEWLRREEAVGAGRSRRPRRTRVCGAGSTRIHQTEMERPAIGAAATERWSVRGPGMRHGVGPLTASEFIQFRRASRFSSGTFTADSDGTRAV